MKNHAYDEYYDDDSFLELVEKYRNEHDNDFDSIKIAIMRKVSDWIYNSHGDKYDVMSYLSEAKTLVNVLQYINDERDEDE
jgi:hypothetical protein